MSSSQRSIARLPLHIFTDLAYLQRMEQPQEYHPERQEYDGQGTTGSNHADAADDVSANANVVSRKRMRESYARSTPTANSNSNSISTPSELRTAICRKLASTSVLLNNPNRTKKSKPGTNRNRNGSGSDGNVNGNHNANATPLSSVEGITTIGQLMRMTPPALLRALDPLLTHGKSTHRIIHVLACTIPVVPYDVHQEEWNDHE
jgi:hypothetical protein